MAITAAMVKELREMTGAGMMDCKKALGETNGDMDAAVTYLREKGISKAEKKASRIAAEGLCCAVVDGKNAAVVEVNSETDFVAKNDIFKEYVGQVAAQALSSNASDMDAFMAEAWNADSSKTVKDALTDKVAVIGENLKIRRFEKVTAEDGFVVSYIHGGGRIAVLLSMKGEENDATKEAAMNVAMQIAAMNPKYVSQADVDQDYLKSEENIIREQIANDPAEAAKPDKVKEGMIKGRISKLMKEVCLLDQVYVRAEDGKQSVAKYLESVGNATVASFVRFETGEGLEKKEENFAEEVAKQMGQ
ncbi:MAG: translation elongation factor Ts [Lachnospiraceae bacterium]|nr:translation elongation factor Ts [Lachnospiraceae bacterium]